MTDAIKLSPPPSPSKVEETAWQPTRRSKRCYHRVMSGIERGGQFRFLTLTSSNDSPDSCQRDWRALYMRLKRRGLVSAYIKVPEASKNGKQHLHVLYRGSYISQAYLSEVWQELHKAKVVDIRKAWSKGNNRRLASYMAKYMSKENFWRYSWSWSWVWRGFVKDWQLLKSLLKAYYHLSPHFYRQGILPTWQIFLLNGRDKGWQMMKEMGFNPWKGV